MRKWAEELHGTLRIMEEQSSHTQDGGFWALLLMPTPESQELTQPRSPSPWSHDTSGIGEGERMLWTKSCAPESFMCYLCDPVLPRPAGYRLSGCPFPFSSLSRSLDFSGFLQATGRSSQRVVAFIIPTMVVCSPKQGPRASVC